MSTNSRPPKRTVNASPFRVVTLKNGRRVLVRRSDNRVVRVSRSPTRVEMPFAPVGELIPAVRRAAAVIQSAIPAVPPFLRGETAWWWSAYLTASLVIGPPCVPWIWHNIGREGKFAPDRADYRWALLVLIGVSVLLAVLDTTYGRMKVRRAGRAARADLKLAEERAADARGHADWLQKQVEAMRRHVRIAMKTCMQGFTLRHGDRVSVFTCHHRDGAYRFALHASHTIDETIRHSEAIGGPLAAVLTRVAATKEPMEVDVDLAFANGGDDYWRAWHSRLDGIGGFQEEDLELYPASILAVPVVDFDEAVGVVVFETAVPKSLQTAKGKARRREWARDGLDKIKDNVKSGLAGMHRHSHDANEVPW
jgi:hypothetical protein